MADDASEWLPAANGRPEQKRRLPRAVDSHPHTAASLTTALEMAKLLHIQFLGPITVPPKLAFSGNGA